MKNRKIAPIIIIGMHRSGTTLAANILNKFGLFIGKSVDDNYESKFFNRMNRIIMNQFAATWDNPSTFSKYSNSKISKLLEEYLKNKINSIDSINYFGVIDFFKTKIYNSYPECWGWKDPRNTITINLWKNIFPKSKIIHIYRNPLDVALSLRSRVRIVLENKKLRRWKHDNIFITLEKRSKPSISPMCENLDGGIKLWENYMKEAKNFLSSQDRNSFIEVKYEDLLTNPEREIYKMVGFCNLNFNKNIFQNFVDKIDESRAYAFKNENISPKYQLKYKDLLDEYYLS